MIDGALRRMSLTKRTTSPNRLARAYSARNVPARIPVGVAMAVAIPVIITLPAMALSNPPLLPGGGVICMNNDGVIAPTPLIKSVDNTRTSHISPKPVAATVNLAGAGETTIDTQAYALLSGGYLTLYQMALIEAGNLDGLALGPLRVIDRVLSERRALNPGSGARKTPAAAVTIRLE